MEVNVEPKWMDAEVRAKIWSKRVAWKEWKRTGRETDRVAYKKIETSSKKMIKNKKNALERSIAKKKNLTPNCIILMSTARNGTAVELGR